MTTTAATYQQKHWLMRYGDLPANWRFMKIGDLFTERKQSTSDLQSYPLFSFTIEDGVTPKTDRYERSFLLRDAENNAYAVVHPGDFVFNPMNLRFGAIACSHTDRPVCVSGYYNILIPNRDKLDSRFFEAYFRSEQMMDVYDRFAIGSLIEKRRVHVSMFRDIEIPVPPLEEQRHTADILSTADRAIDRTGRLIKARRKLKKGLAQQLLTGQRRFPGFGGAWQSGRLGKLVTLHFSGIDKKSHATEQPVWLCNYTDVYYNDRITPDIDFMQATASKTEVENFSLKQWDVIITKDSETPDDIAKPAVVVQNMPGVVCGYHLAILRPTHIDGPFLAQLLRLSRTRYEFYRVANGVTRFGLTQSALRRLELRIPRADEQRRIAAVLGAADRGIALLEKKLAALAELKRGLMQKLLSNPAQAINEGVGRHA